MATNTPSSSSPRRVLMLCYYYPPVHAVGTLRSLAFSRNLLELGWKPIVLTVSKCRDPWVTVDGTQPPDGVEVHRFPELPWAQWCDALHGITRRITNLFGHEPKRNWFRDLYCLPDPQVTWLPLFTGIKLARDAEIVYVSSLPYSAAVHGAWIKQRTGKPLVLDFRDPWSVGTFADSGSRIRQRISRALERWTIERADLVILNTKATEEVYRNTFPEFAERFVTIPNGFDTLPQIAAPSEGPFRIVHAGTFFGDRSPSVLLSALSALPFDDIEFVQVGPVPEELPAQVGRVKVTSTGLLSPEEARAHIASASLLYLKRGQENPVAVAAKTYEYLASGRPILVDAPPGENVRVVKEYASRAYVVETGNDQDLKVAVQQAYAERSHPAGVTEKFRLDYDRKRLTARLSTLFDQLAVKRQ